MGILTRQLSADARKCHLLGDPIFLVIAFIGVPMVLGYFTFVVVMATLVHPRQIVASRNEDLISAVRDGPVRKVAVVSDNVTDEGIRYLVGARGLLVLALNSDSLTDESIRTAAGFLGLMKLSIHSPKVTDVGLSALVNHELIDLDVSGTSVTDACVDTLLRMPNLRLLRMDDTALTDEGASRLADHPTLSDLSLRGTKVSDSCAAILRGRIRVSD